MCCIQQNKYNYTPLYETKISHIVKEIINDENNESANDVSVMKLVENPKQLSYINKELSQKNKDTTKKIETLEKTMQNLLVTEQ